MAAAIEIQGLEKTYSVGFWHKRPRRALHPLHLAVEQGEIFGFLGPNGAGKTTTLKLLMGLIFPTSGTARILGLEVSNPQMKAQIGYLPEQPYFYDYLTAPELLGYYAELSGMPARGRSQKVEAMLQRVGLADVGRLQLRKFSKGMLQRVGIAQAILHDPKVVFLDEPMSGLDPIGRREVRDLIQSLKDEGKTVFFSTHILSDAESLCDRVAVLHKGELRALGAVSELTAGAESKVEVTWQGPRIPAIASLSSEWRMTGDTVRAVLAESSLERALEALRREHARLLSVAPVRMTLEQYFMEQLGPSAAAGQKPARQFAVTAGATK
jgi:ABC-2 type transport system ATP-binding protein